MSQHDWKHHGVRVIHANELDPGNVPQTQGMSRAAAIDRKSTRLNSSHERLSRMPSSA